MCSYKNSMRSAGWLVYHNVRNEGFSVDKSEFSFGMVQSGTTKLEYHTKYNIEQKPNAT